MLVQINDIEHPIAFEDAEAVLGLLRKVTAGWQFRPADGTPPPGIRVSGTAQGYRIASPHRPAPLLEASDVSAACTLIVDLIEATVVARADMLCLHAGAIDTGRGLVVFPSRRRAGKSTLIARLASLGMPAFADDVLPLAATGAGVEARAFGVASRLRLPLPGGLAPDFLSHCAAHRGPEDRYYRYLLPSAGTLVPYGRAAPVAAFVFLDRVAGDCAPTLSPADHSLAMEALLLQNFGIAASAGAIFARFERLIGDAGLYVLRYGALDPAARLIVEVFGPRRAGAIPAGPGVAVPLPRNEDPPRGARPAGDAVLCRADGIWLREVAGRAFLIDEERGAIFALDGIGGAVWTLLAEPVSENEIVAILAAAFADVARDTIGRDVGGFLDAVIARGLVRTMAGPRSAAV